MRRPYQGQARAALRASPAWQKRYSMGCHQPEVRYAHLGQRRYPSKKKSLTEIPGKRRVSFFHMASVRGVRGTTP